MKGSLTGLRLLSLSLAVPSGWRTTSTCTWRAEFEYSMPWALNTSGLAMRACRASSSAAVAWGTSISARSGSPSADCTAMRPRVRAEASVGVSAAEAKAAAARAESFQRCIVRVVWLCRRAAVVDRKGLPWIHPVGAHLGSNVAGSGPQGPGPDYDQGTASPHIGGSCRPPRWGCIQGAGTGGHDTDALPWPAGTVCGSAARGACRCRRPLFP